MTEALYGSIQTGLPKGSGAKAEVRGVFVIGRNAVVVAMGTGYAPLRPVSYETAVLLS
jgi:7-cyano-7-deazaguanine synthase in queuosine biosynthesis